MSTELAKPEVTKPEIIWTEREEKFWIHYLADEDRPKPTEAARRAGYKNPGESSRKILKKAEKTPTPLFRDGMLQVGANPVELGRILGLKALQGDMTAIRSAAAAWGVNTKNAEGNRTPMQVSGHNVQIIVAGEDKERLEKMLAGPERPLPPTV